MFTYTYQYIYIYIYGYVCIPVVKLLVGDNALHAPKVANVYIYMHIHIYL